MWHELKSTVGCYLPFFANIFRILKAIIVEHLLQFIQTPENQRPLKILYIFINEGVDTNDAADIYSRHMCSRLI